MSQEPEDIVKDWRGTPIEIGHVVIYGTGRAVELVEGVVEGFTKSGRVTVQVVRRSFGWASQGRVHVGPTSLTVIDLLPDATVPTMAEAKELRVAAAIARATERLAAIEAGAKPHYPGEAEYLRGHLEVVTS